MLEKPDLQDDLMLTRARDEFGLPAAQVAFLPLGYDLNTAVYRLVMEEGNAYFLKLRKGDFDEIAVALPKLLKAQGVQAIIAPLETRAGQRWGNLGEYKMVLYPFIEGANGYELALTDQQWLNFGVAIKGVHSAQVPSELMRLTPRETYSSLWREMVRRFQALIEETAFDEPVAIKLAAFMRSKRDEISHVVERAEQLGSALNHRSMELVLCHADIHPGNLLITTEGVLYIVDWDNPILAPKERDLALIGGCPTWSDPRQATHFFQGYGPAQIDYVALAYYRYERIVLDIAEFCKQLLLSDEGGEDREQSLQYLTSNFLPGHEIELAHDADELQT